MPQTDDQPEELLLKTARQILFALSGAYKKLNLYSETHNVYKEALRHLQTLVAPLVQEFGRLRLHIERDGITFNGEAVYEGTLEPTDFVSVLHRDGFLWVEFKEGIESWEFDTFLKAMRDHSVLGEDAEDDIVTALWEFDLPSIAYEADELVLGLNEDLVIEDLPCRPPEGDDATAPNDECQSKSRSAGVGKFSEEAATALKAPAQLYRLSQEEREQLAKMIAAEEQMDGSDHVVDVLLYIIGNHCLPEDVDELLAYMGHELREALLQGRFLYLHTVLIKFRKQFKSYQSMSHWAAPYLERFILKLSNGSFLENLLAISPLLDESEPQGLIDLKAFLSLLDPEAISSLAPIMLKVRSAKLQRILLNAIATLSKRDIRPLEKLLLASDKILAGRLVFILKFFNDAHSRRLLSRLLCDESAAIRLQALKAVLAGKEQCLIPEEVATLLGDPDEEVRKLLLQSLAGEKSVQSEKLLLDHLKSLTPEHEDPEYFLSVCRSLGKCGSYRCVPFLKSLLFKWPQFGVLRPSNSIQRRGAILALESLGTTEAADLIKKAERGFLGNFLRAE